MGISTTRYGYGTYVVKSYPFGEFVTAKVMCSDGRVRTTRRLARTADTFFSVPCDVMVKGKRVAGYMTFGTADGMSTATEDDPEVVKFIAYSYGKNGHLLPGLGWTRDKNTEVQK